MASKDILLTSDLRLACAVNGQLAFLPIKDFEASSADIVHLTAYQQQWRLETKKGNILRWCDLDLFNFDRPIAKVSLKIVPDKTAPNKNIKPVSLQISETGSLSRLSYADPQNPCWQSAIKEKTSFFMISRKMLNLLLTLHRHNWILGPEAEEISFDFHPHQPLPVKFGQYRFDLPSFLEILENSSPEEELIFLAEGQIHRAVPFCPMVLYCIFGERVLNEFDISIRSLVEFGEYNATLVICTDLPEEFMRSKLPEALKNKTRILKGTAKDRDDFISAKQYIFTRGGLLNASPLLYLDCDVIIDKALMPTLRRAALSRFIDAQMESFDSFFGTTPTKSHGEDLYEKDPFPIKLTYGFNTGVVTFPLLNAQKSRELMSAYHTNLLYNEMYGRGSLVYTEQAVLNYALLKSALFKYNFLTQTINIGGDESDFMQRHGNNNPEQRKGFIHFWCAPSGSQRHKIMKTYFDQLKQLLKENEG